MAHSNFVADENEKEGTVSEAIVGALTASIMGLSPISPVLTAILGGAALGFGLSKKIGDRQEQDDELFPTSEAIEAFARNFIIDRTASGRKAGISSTQAETPALPLDPETQAKVDAVKKAVSELPPEGFLQIVGFVGKQLNNAQPVSLDLLFEFPEFFQLQKAAEQFITAVVGISDRKQLCLADIAVRDLMASIAELSGGRCEFSRGLDIEGKDIPAFRSIGKFPELIAFELAIKRFKPEFENAMKRGVGQKMHYTAAGLAKGIFGVLQAQTRLVFEVEDATATVGFEISGQTPFAKWHDKISGEPKSAGLGGKPGRPPKSTGDIQR